MWILAVKTAFEDWTGLPHPVLHLSFGLFIFWVAHYATKSIWLSLWTLLALEIINEANDILPIWYDNRSHHPYYTGWADNLDDVVWTMVVPFAIAVVITMSRHRAKRRRRGRIKVSS